MKEFMRRCKDFSRDQRGQTTVEYMLILSVSVGLFLVVFKALLLPALTAFQKSFTQKMMGIGNNLHSFKMSH